MQKSKYLEELGLNPNLCDWIDQSDPQYQEMIDYENKYGVFPPANWNFDGFFARWLYCYLKDYLKDAGEMVDLNFYKFEQGGETYSEEEAIKKILTSLKEYITADNSWESLEEIQRIVKNYQKAIHLFAEILPALWW